MESINISNQTVSQFIEAPFHIPNAQKNLKYEDRYQSFKKSNKIKIESSIEFEKNYFIHLKVPSESMGQDDVYYDVVIQFFTSDPEVEKQLTVQNYFVQFFSNSPGFMYKYAALYKLEGYLIESLCDKFAPGALNTLPDKANKNYDLYFDSSIYYACRYLIDNKLTTLGKLTLKLFKTKTPERFFGDIQDTESVSIIRSSAQMVSSIRKEIDNDQALSEQQQKKLIKNGGKKIAGDVFDDMMGKKKPIKAKSSTFKNPKDSSIKVKKSSIQKVTKKKPSRSTTKK